MKFRVLAYCTVAALILAPPRAAVAQTASAHTFQIFIRGVQAGSEEVTLLQTADGFALRGSGRIGPPLNLATQYWEARYDARWNPLELTVNQADAANTWSVHTTIDRTAAGTDVTQNGQNQRHNTTVAADSVLLPNLIFGSYEALAARLASSAAGSQLPGFIVPQSVVSIGVTRVSDEKIQMPGRTIDTRHWSLAFGGPNAPLNMDVWTEGTRLLRVDIPSQMVSVIRDDISSVSARLATMSRNNDEQVTIPANGFSLAATISKPVLPSPRGMGAVVLVSGAPGADRDEMVAGIPIFAQLAASLADAGLLVVRYDKRGTGQSGGRPESASYDDFALDARAVIAFLAKRKDIDPKRIGVVGYGEGGWVALAAAAKESRMAALALINTPSAKGTDLVLEQQRELLAANGATTEAQQTAIAQQKLILDAVITGKGWDTLSADVRRRVDTAAYRSFLTFDPAMAVSRTRQPLLVFQADLDKEVPAYHGEQLAQLGRSRTKARPTDFVHLPGLNHLLAAAKTGEVGEYSTLADRTISQAAGLALSTWLTQALAPAETKK